jgi:HAD superfamily hydrolase (TIGR01509 family)
MAQWPQLGHTGFDAVVFSCAEGAVKPERKIYEIAARKLHAPPQRCAFIDDRPNYVDGARNAGMSAIRYEDLPQVERALTALGVTVPARAK